MQLFTILPLLTLLVPRISGTPVEARATSAKECLTDKDVTSILSLWSSLKVGDVSKINKVVSKRFEGTNNDVNNGTSAVFVKGRDAYKEYVTLLNDPTKYDAVGVNQTTIFSFHDCDQIAYRWYWVGSSTDLSENRTGIAAGKTIIETGTDLLKVDVSSKKIYEAVTSQDSLYYNWQLGYTEGYTEQPKN